MSPHRRYRKHNESDGNDGGNKKRHAGSCRGKVAITAPYQRSKTHDLRCRESSNDAVLNTPPIPPKFHHITFLSSNSEEELSVQNNKRKRSSKMRHTNVTIPVPSQKSIKQNQSYSGDDDDKIQHITMTAII